MCLEEMAPFSVAGLGHPAGVTVHHSPNKEVPKVPPSPVCTGHGHNIIGMYV